VCRCSQKIAGTSGVWVGMVNAPALMQLRDGTVLDVRPVEPEDRDLIRGGFERLSPVSRYRRFLSPVPKLHDRMLTSLTEVDHRDHEALLTLDAATGEVVGVARFVRLESDPASAEVAVTVVDDWQSRGLGTALLGALADRAREESVTRFTGVALAENRDVLGLLGKLGAVRVVGHGPGTVELAIDLPAERVALRADRSAPRRALPEISSVIPGTELVGKAPPPRPASPERLDQAKGQS
jgi:GNAT superfamily N-acetyltransferase